MLSKNQDGQSLAEFALVLPFLMVIMLGLIELGHAYGRIHALAGISREGANIAARGEPPANVLNVVLLNGDDINLRNNGGAVVTQVVQQGGAAVVQAQYTSSGCSNCTSRVGSMNLSSLNFTDKSTHWVVEVFYAYNRITPLQNFLNGIIPNPMYEFAVF